MIPALPFAVPSWAWKLLGAVLLLIAFVAMIHMYGNARYKAGVSDTDKLWQEASERLTEKASHATEESNREAAERAADYAEQVAIEKEKIDDAVKNGDSPIDVLFGAGD